MRIEPLRTGLDTAHHRLLAPRELLDGSVVWEEQQDIGRRLREGDPTVGWTGDPGLSLVRNTTWVDPKTGRRTGRWEVWRRHEDGTASVVCWRRGTRLPGVELLRQLAEHDTRCRDVVSEVEAHNEQVERRKDRDFADWAEDAGDKLAWALGRDLGEPAQDGRLYRLGG